MRMPFFTQDGSLGTPESSGNAAELLHISGAGFPYISIFFQSHAGNIIVTAFFCLTRMKNLENSFFF